MSMSPLTPRKDRRAPYAPFECTKFPFPRLSIGDRALCRCSSVGEDYAVPKILVVVSNEPSAEAMPK